MKKLMVTFMCGCTLQSHAMTYCEKHGLESDEFRDLWVSQLFDLRDLIIRLDATSMKVTQ